VSTATPRFTPHFVRKGRGRKRQQRAQVQVEVQVLMGLVGVVVEVVGAFGGSRRQ
jgi:hypothetical protein